MKEILVALIVSVAFPLGAMLYSFTREELIWKNIGQALRKATYVLAAVYASLVFALSYFQALEFSAAIFAIILVQSALASIGLKSKASIKRSLSEVFVFLIFWSVIYLLV